MATIRAGALDRRITFARAAVADDGFASPPGPAADLVTVWAQVTPVSDAERIAAGGVRGTIDTRFLVRWSSATADVTTKDSISYAGRSYGIQAIKEIGHREGLEFSATAQA